MTTHLQYALLGLLLATGVFIGMLLLLELGQRIGRWRAAKDPDAPKVEVGDMLSHDAQPALREQFRQYVDGRLAAYRSFPDVAARLGLIRLDAYDQLLVDVRESMR